MMLRERTKRLNRRPKVSEVASGVYALALGRGAISTNVYLVRCGASWSLIDAGWSGSEKHITAAAEAVFGPGPARFDDLDPPASRPFWRHPDAGGAVGAASVRAFGRVAAGRGIRVRVRDPIDRWLVPLIRRLPSKMQTTIAAGADLRSVVQTFDPTEGVPAMPGWAAIHTPGHTPGHVSLYRTTDGVVITGDAVTAVDLNSLCGVLAGKPGVFGPPRYTTWDPRAARRSIGVLTGLAPKVLASGHGRVQVDEVASRLRLLAVERRSPARWRQGLLAPVDYTARTRYRPPPPLYQRVQGRLGPWLIGLGVGPPDVVVLEVPGRRSGVVRRTTVVKTRHDGEEYLVALAGESQPAVHDKR